MQTKKLWLLLLAVLIGTFTILGFFGREVYRQAPPIPEAFVTANGETLFTKDDILTGQTVWQSIGGQQVGSIWGHGAYQAPDWTADWLHRELVHYLDIQAQKVYQSPYENLSTDKQRQLQQLTKDDYRSNTFDPKTQNITISDARIAAFKATQKHYIGLFSSDPDYWQLREDYAIQDDILKDPKRRIAMTQFFYWSVWSASTNRPGENYTYTNNWPHEPLIDNTVTTGSVFWSIISISLLLAGVGFLLWYFAFRKEEESLESNIPRFDPLANLTITPSMKALWKYVLVVIALFIIQIFLGALTAHYTVEGQDFFGFPIAKFIPYSLSRTWHIQTALFWIATSFLTAGLFLAPLINGGKDPKGQRLGVNILFGALLVVVGGSLTGELLAIHQLLNLEHSFWLGHQGYEYTDLGRIWQIALLVGLGLWLFLMLRAIVPALRLNPKHKEMLTLFTGATAAIGLFYTAGLFYGAKTHLSVMEYWRWWVVHLWVEGFFEVFATVAISFVFYQLGLVRIKTATRAVLFATSIFLIGGIPGTFHHLYFSGTPISISAIGACFSALEVVPLLLVGREAYETYQMRAAAPWMERYKWPITFFIGVAFWNLVGAGLFGFLINPPVALYYMQGLNTTAVHAHGATFGVYGLLSLGLVLVVLRHIGPKHIWNDLPLKIAFWGMNGGLAMMILFSLLPIGLIQTWASMEHGLWYARSSELLQTPLIEGLRWMRIIGDTVFIVGALSLAYFVFGMRYRQSFPMEKESLAYPDDAEVGAQQTVG